MVIPVADGIQAVPSELVETQLDSQGLAIDPRGVEDTTDSIGERLAVRNYTDELRSTGVETGGPAAYGTREKQAFANALDRALTRAMRR